MLPANSLPPLPAPMMLPVPMSSGDVGSGTYSWPRELAAELGMARVAACAPFLNQVWFVPLKVMTRCCQTFCVRLTSNSCLLVSVPLPLKDVKKKFPAYCPTQKPVQLV